MSELGDFLRTCRAAVSPSDVGLPETERRRVPGLRREEVARLVGLSTDYYVRLEQGRSGRPSQSVLDAIARALGLDSVRKKHLEDLAHASATAPARPTRPAYPRAGAGVVSLLDTMDVPAMVMTRCAQVIAWNPLCARLLAPFDELEPEERNIARLLFSDSDLAARHGAWEESARDLVGMLRMTAGRDPGNVRLQELVGELSVGSEAFRAMWAEHHVHEKTGGRKLVDHPELGRFELRYETFVVACDAEQQLVTYTAEPGSPAADALALLRTLVAGDAAVRA